MYCKYCGKPIESGVRFCPECGQRQDGPAEGTNGQPERVYVVRERPQKRVIPGYRFAKSSVVLGIIGLCVLLFSMIILNGEKIDAGALMFILYYVFVFPAPALIFAGIGFWRLRSIGYSLSKPIAGIILNGLQMVGVLYLLLR